jgi:hypothetical protein
MLEGDEILVSINQDCPWGHKARNQLMRAARGDFILFQDDDDETAPGAFDVIRAAVEMNPHTPHLFKMRYADGTEIWQLQQVTLGNVSTQMIVVPNISEKLGTWKEDAYEGDYYFISSTLRNFGEMVWHTDVISLVKPE